MNFRPLLLAFFASFLFLFLQDRPCQAAKEFGTSYDIIYNVETDGITRTSQTINLTNKLDHVFATEYQVIIGSTSIEKVTANDNYGELEPKVENKDNATIINLEFDKKMIGKDKTRTIHLTYQTPDFATIKGKVLEVGFPILTNSNDLEEYSVSIRIPDSFGQPTQFIPTTYQGSQLANYQVFNFTKADLEGSDGITATFGTSQIYNFVIRYHLQNKEEIKGRAELALPNDTNYQTVLYQEIKPKPLSVNVDADGNWLAEYIVEPGQSQTIEAQGSIRLNYFPKENFAKNLTSEQKRQYTKSDVYWESSSQTVEQIAKDLQTPKEIYDYLISNFIYDYGRLETNPERLGAAKALQNPDNAICMEFTDAFIALARSAGIPAREHNGFAYTENDRLRPLSLSQDVLHAWPEYYDETAKQWIQIDPTWGNTTGGLNFFDKFDLDHISFVTHGTESSYPVTVGSYKTDDSQGKDVAIEFGDKFEPKESYELLISNLPSGLAGLPVEGEILISNTGNVALYDLPVVVNLSKNGQQQIEKDYSIAVLPPFATYTFHYSQKTNWQTDGGSYQLNVSVLEAQQSQNFELKTIINPTYLVWIGGGAFGSLLWFIGFSIAIKKISKPKTLIPPIGNDPSQQIPLNH
ncbi:transglutaminase domain-containing protein [Candidatus Beckwithbacteria bacterium]|nr:transglutaminase domain-containing protein [Candidatus Beckwithbacteria bacterium]